MPPSLSRHHKHANPNPGYATQAKLLRLVRAYAYDWDIDQLVKECRLPVSRKQTEDWVDYKAEEAIFKLAPEDLRELLDLLQSPAELPDLIRRVYHEVKRVWDKDNHWKPSACLADDTGHLRAAGLGRLTRANYPGRHAIRVPEPPIIYPDPYRETLYGPTCIIPLPLCEVLAAAGAQDCEGFMADLAAAGYTIQPRRRRTSVSLGQLVLFGEAA